jgi:hypothetical protein
MDKGEGVDGSWGGSRWLDGMTPTTGSGMGERRKEPGWVKGEADRWVPPGDLNEFKNPNFVQTWFAPKVIFLGSKNLDENTDR